MDEKSIVKVLRVKAAIKNSFSLLSLDCIKNLLSHTILESV